MKKTFALLLALVLALSLSATAFAAAPAALDASEPSTFSFDKVWKNAEGTQVPDELVPQETLHFDVAVTTAPVENAPMLTVADVEAATGNQTVEITVPVYTVLGVYKYTITEKAGDTQGVVYSTEPIEVEVMVTNAAEGEGLEKTIYFTKKVGETEVKLSSIENIYNYSTPDPDGKYKDLTVDKQVTGNLADKNQKFSIDVTFNSAKPVRSPITYNGNQTIAPEAWAEGSVTVTIETSHKDGAVSFSHIPAGVTYTVTEQAKHTAADETKNNPETGYTVSYTGEKGTISDKASNAVVTNEKGTEIKTGVMLDSAPYIVMLTVAVLGTVLFTVKKKHAED